MEIYLDRNKKQKFTDYEVDEAGYAVISGVAHTLHCFGDSKVKLIFSNPQGVMLYVYDYVEIEVYGFVFVIAKNKSRVRAFGYNVCVELYDDADGEALQGGTITYMKYKKPPLFLFSLFIFSLCGVVIIFYLF